MSGPPLAPPPLAHCPTGIDGLDRVMNGGFPRGRATLVAGGPGCGKTLLATEFLVRGAEQGEPGLLVTFEETAGELTTNVASLGWDLEQLQRDGLLALDHIHLERKLIEQTGDYDLEALFIRIGHAIDSIGAKRVAIDTIEVLFSALDDSGVLRAELHRLFTWLKERDVTSVVTAERGDGSVTRHGLEEYVSDCVLTLDHRVEDQRAIRRLRIVKLRGSAHGTNEYPFLIGATGFQVVPITAFDLTHPASTEVVSTGVAGLDGMIRAGGWYRGSTTMISGESGSAKSIFAAHFVDAACRRGERSLYLAFEESEAQIVRNMASVGLRLDRWIDDGLLRIVTSRPTQAGLENHLTALYTEVDRFDPRAVVLDPVTDFTALGSNLDVKGMLMRIVDFLKTNQITAVLTSLIHDQSRDDPTISSLIDNWVQVRNLESEFQRNRALYIQKARGMAHSNQILEFELSDAGIRVLDVFAGSQGVVHGRARQAQQEGDR